MITRQVGHRNVRGSEPILKMVAILLWFLVEGRAMNESAQRGQQLVPSPAKDDANFNKWEEFQNQPSKEETQKLFSAHEPGSFRPEEPVAADDTPILVSDPFVNDNLQRNWNLVMQQFQKISQDPVEVILNLISKLVVPLPSDISELCQQHIRLFFSELIASVREQRNPMNEWSLQMLDALPKLPPGLLRGALTWTGSFRECVNIEVMNNQTANVERNKKDAGVAFVGEHCFIKVHLPQQKLSNMEVNGKLSFCFPSTCNNDDKERLVQYVALQAKVEASLDPMTCVRNVGPSMDATAILLSIVLLMPAILVVIGSVLDLGRPRLRDHNASEGFWAHFSLRFSIRKSWESIFRKPRNSGNEFDFIYGIRSLSILSVIYGHVYEGPFIPGYPWNEYLDIKDGTKRPYNVIIASISIYSVDTFFVAGGFCVGYFFMQASAHRKISITETSLMFINRYVRLTPSFAFMVALLAGPWMYLQNGPFWPVISKVSQACRQNWWTQLLYIGNLNIVNTSTDFGTAYCINPSWYMMADMQIYLIVLPIIMLLIRKPKWGLFVISGLFVASTAARWIIYFANDLPFIFSTTQTYETVEKVNRLAYEMPWTRAQPYFLGMIVGYYLHIIGLAKIHIKPLMLCLGWSCSFIAPLCIHYVNYYYMAGEFNVPRSLDCFMAAIAPIVWSLSISWIIVACSTGHGGFITSFLSCSFFTCLGRLTYCLLLTHYVIIQLLYSSSRNSYSIDEYLLFNLFVSTTVISIAASFILFIMIESPLASIKLGRSSSSEPKEFIANTSILQHQYPVSKKITFGQETGYKSSKNY